MGIKRYIQTIYPWLRGITENWPDIISALTRYRPKIHYCIIKWAFPSKGRLKCNTNGASKGNPGPSSYGFCIRNYRGDLIYAQAAQIGLATNMEAEAKAILEAARFCQIQNIPNVLIETDSQGLRNILKHKWKIPWAIVEHIEEIIELMNNMSMTIQHIYREGNALTDYLANTALKHEELIQFHRFQDLPTTGKRMLNTDKSQLPAIRISTRRIL